MLFADFTIFYSYVNFPIYPAMVLARASVLDAGAVYEIRNLLHNHQENNSLPPDTQAQQHRLKAEVTATLAVPWKHHSSYWITIHLINSDSLQIFMYECSFEIWITMF